jgi:hypothetical protein
MFWVLWSLGRALKRGLFEPQHLSLCSSVDINTLTLNKFQSFHVMMIHSQISYLRLTRQALLSFR